MCRDSDLGTMGLHWNVFPLPVLIFGPLESFPLLAINDDVRADFLIKTVLPLERSVGPIVEISEIHVLGRLTCVFQ